MVHEIFPVTVKVVGRSRARTVTNLFSSGIYKPALFQAWQTVFYTLSDSVFTLRGTILIASADSSTLSRTVRTRAASAVDIAINTACAPEANRKSPKPPASLRRRVLGIRDATLGWATGDPD
jgi:hypothetical protein